MNVETKLPQKQSVAGGGRISNETYITLFMIGVLVVLFLLACVWVPNFYQPQNIINLLRTSGT
jgi:hypothetical protein